MRPYQSATHNKTPLNGSDADQHALIESLIGRERLSSQQHSKLSSAFHQVGQPSRALFHAMCALAKDDADRHTWIVDATIQMISGLMRFSDRPDTQMLRTLGERTIAEHGDAKAQAELAIKLGRAVHLDKPLATTVKTIRRSTALLFNEKKHVAYCWGVIAELLICDNFQAPAEQIQRYQDLANYAQTHGLTNIAMIALNNAADTAIVDENYAQAEALLKASQAIYRHSTRSASISRASLLYNIHLLKQARGETTKACYYCLSSAMMQIQLGSTERANGQLLDLHQLYTLSGQQHKSERLEVLLTQRAQNGESQLENRSNMQHQLFSGQFDQSQMFARFSLLEQTGQEEFFRMALEQLEYRKLMLDELHRTQFNDPLTGLPNRTALEQSLYSAIQTGSCGLLLWAPDNFESIYNDQGLAVRDKVLQQVAHDVELLLDDGSRLFSWDSGKFFILLQPHNDSKMKHLLDKLGDYLSNAFQIDGHQVPLAASYGYCAYPDDGVTLQALLQAVEIAFFEAKSPKNAAFIRYSATLGKEARLRKNLSNDFGRAIVNKELQLHWQPIVNLQTKEVVGCEALLRWYRHHDQIILPGKLTNLLESRIYGSQIGMAVINMALEEFAKVQPNPKQFISINFPERLTDDTSISEKLTALCDEYGVRYSQVHFEVTEHLAFRDLQTSQRTLEKIQQAGFQISLDDFGVGFSSFSKLTELNIDHLKLDMTFAHAIAEGNPAKNQVCQTILSLCQNLNLPVIAEGIEHGNQAKWFAQHGVELFQGFHFMLPDHDLAQALSLDLDTVVPAPV